VSSDAGRLRSGPELGRLPAVRGTLAPTGDAECDELVNTDPLALVIAMLLDQQMPIEWAFRGPARLAARLGGHLDPAAIAAMDPDAFAALAAERPAIHRFPRAMARRIQALCAAVVADLHSDASGLWREAASAEALHHRLVALPGFGDEKARILLAVLAKRFGVRPDGWERWASPFDDDEPRSVADIDGPDALARVRAWKATQRAAGRAKTDPPPPATEGAAPQAAVPGGTAGGSPAATAGRRRRRR
jgi:uncharacterized HhH-GPD family protein